MEYKEEIQKVAKTIIGMERTAVSTRDVALAFTRYLIGDREIALRELQKLKTIPNQVLGFEYHEDNYTKTFDNLFSKILQALKSGLS